MADVGGSHGHLTQNQRKLYLGRRQQERRAVDPRGRHVHVMHRVLCGQSAEMGYDGGSRI